MADITKLVGTQVFIRDIAGNSSMPPGVTDITAVAAVDSGFFLPPGCDKIVGKVLEQGGWEKMKISRAQIENVIKAYSRQSASSKPVKGKEGTPVTREDKVVISQQARDLQLAREAAIRATEVREGKVEEIRAALESGRYHVSGEEIAEKILGRSLVDKLV